MEEVEGRQQHPDFADITDVEVGYDIPLACSCLKTFVLTRKPYLPELVLPIRDVVWFITRQPQMAT